MFHIDNNNVERTTLFSKLIKIMVIKKRYILIIVKIRLSTELGQLTTGRFQYVDKQN